MPGTVRTLRVWLCEEILGCRIGLLVTSPFQGSFCSEDHPKQPGKRLAFGGKKQMVEQNGGAGIPLVGNRENRHGAPVPVKTGLGSWTKPVAQAVGPSTKNGTHKGPGPWASFFGWDPQNGVVFVVLPLSLAKATNNWYPPKKKAQATCLIGFEQVLVCCSRKWARLDLAIRPDMGARAWLSYTQNNNPPTKIGSIADLVVGITEYQLHIPAT